jgi:hypothetical protein
MTYLIYPAFALTGRIEVVKGTLVLISSPIVLLLLAYFYGPGVMLLSFWTFVEVPIVAFGAFLSRELLRKSVIL